jgi:hypothetical protein
VYLCGTEKKILEGRMTSKYDAEIDRQVAGIADMMGLPFDRTDVINDAYQSLTERQRERRRLAIEAVRLRRAERRAARSAREQQRGW